MAHHWVYDVKEHVPNGRAATLTFQGLERRFGQRGVHGPQLVKVVNPALECFSALRQVVMSIVDLGYATQLRTLMVQDEFGHVNGHTRSSHHSGSRSPKVV